jgi:nucleoside 2-deoxyribosyltransferase
MIEQADIVIANLNSFRGKEPDSGTVWEVGYAIAKGKRVFGYIQESGSYLERFAKDEKIQESEIYRDTNGDTIEDFGLETNLMIACSIEGIEKDFEAVLRKL